MENQDTSSASNHSRATKNLIKAVQKDDLIKAADAIKKGADVNVRLKNNDNTLLHVVLSVKMARLLLNKGAHLNAINAHNQIPLHSSMHRGFVKITEYLINQGSLVNAAEDNGYTPLHLAQKPSIAKKLLRKHANPNAADIEGDTPLHIAARSKGTPIVDPLIRKGADVNKTNNVGKTPYNLLEDRAIQTNQYLLQMAKRLRPTGTNFSGDNNKGDKMITIGPCRSGIQQQPVTSIDSKLSNDENMVENHTSQHKKQKDGAKRRNKQRNKGGDSTPILSFSSNSTAKPIPKDTVTVPVSKRRKKER